MQKQSTEHKGLRLLDKGKKGFFHMVFSRMGLMILLLVIQFGLLLAGFALLKEWMPHIFGTYAVFTVVMVLVLMNSDLEPSVKLTWMVVIMILPVFGSLFYYYTRRDLGHRMLKARLQQVQQQTRHLLEQEPQVERSLREENPGAAAMARYVRRSSACPVYDKTAVTYFPSGEEKFARLKMELEQAEHFIFLEYFIIDEGTMWGEVLEILARKAAQGVDVRVMYDGTCEFVLLPKGYPKMLAELGIQCKVFAPVAPFLSTHYNYRDHRKIVVIDGHTAFTGGVNLADEYINEKERFGHWKDTAILLKGEAVRSFTLMFLQMWGLDVRSPEYHKFLSYPTNAPVDTGGFVMPYCDAPLDSERVGERVYLDILNRAERYVHIMTPYLILDSEMEDALRYAAQRGVDVRLILPGTPDKKTAYVLAKTHFKSLLDAGVKLYLYTPGFIHAKSFVADDREAVVGTINLDYRSLYHHFECAAYLYRVDAVADVERDFQDTQKKCSTVTRETIRREKWTTKLAGFVLKFLAPLL